MSYLLLLVIVWKPIYHFVFWAKSKFKDTVEKDAIVEWGIRLYSLVKP